MSEQKRENNSLATKLGFTLGGLSAGLLASYYIGKYFRKDISIVTNNEKSNEKASLIYDVKTQENEENSLPKYDSNGCVIELSDAQWREFWENGFVKIGRTMTEDELSNLRQRMEDIMYGKIDYKDKLLMQLDPSIGDNASDYFANKVYSNGQTVGFKGKTLNYRKIGEAGNGLECDNLYLDFIKKPLFKSICKRVYGNHASIGIYRAMVFNKPAKQSDKNAGGGTRLPWHQDGGNWWALDRDPLCFVWTALYPSNTQNGCVKAIKKSYKLGILSQEGHMLSNEDIEKYCSNNDKNYEMVDLITNPGESWLVHNWTIHSSGINKTNIPRWAFSCNYIDGRTHVLNPKPKDSGELGKPGQSFPIVFDSF